MKTRNFLMYLLLFGLFLSCEKNEEVATVSFSGKAQKGPFITGTTVTLYELNPNLGQTGRSFSTNITTDEGDFSLNNIVLTTDLVLLTANGFYFSEIYGELSEAPLSLQAISDLSKNETVNINILTHLIKGRIEKLVAEGMGFQMAYDQAKTEMLSFLNIDEAVATDFEKLDITGDEDCNGILLAFSIMLQRYTQVMKERPLVTAELSQLLAHISTDFALDGEVNNRSLIDKILINISRLNLLDTRKNIEKRYTELGQNVSIPNFEKYIAKFQEKYSENLYDYFFYPENATPEPVRSPESVLPNLLDKSPVVFKADRPYALAAIIPMYKSLTIKFIGNNYYNYNFGGPIHGWSLTNNYPDGFELKSQRQNELITMLFYLEAPGIATIEYYEDNATTPTFTKNIKWE